MRHAATAALLALAASAAFAQQAPDGTRGNDTAVQQQIQKRVQAETDQTVRRLNTMLRAMAFHRLEQSEESRILGEVAGTLSSLSKDQMNQVLERLKAAAKQTDEQKSNAEVEEAYKRHREILDHLNRLLARYDAVRSLEQAAERMDKISKDELEVYLQEVQLGRQGRQLAAAIQRAEENLAQEKDETKKKALEQVVIAHQKQMDRTLQAIADKLADDQADSQRETAELFRQLGELRPELPAEHQQRLAKVEAMYKQRQVAAAFEDSIRKLRSRNGQPETRVASWKASGFLMWKTSGDLKEMARGLRTPVEDLEALREARQALDEAIERQTALKEEATLPRPQEWEKVERRARDLGDREARVEFDAKDTKALLKPLAPQVAAKIEPAEAAMREAQEALRDHQKPQALAAQEKALTTLKEALKDLDKTIKEAEKAKEDPVAALKALSESIDKLIQDQKETKQKTEDQKKEAEKLPKIAPEQKNLTERTKDLQTQPAADKKVDAALDKAAQAMEKATNNLESKKAPEATQNQEKALSALEEAKKAADEALAKAEAAQDQALPNAAQQIAKAIEQAQAAQENAEHAAQQPNLAEMQKQIAQQAQQKNLEGAKPADKAAQALEKGNLKEAIKEQAQALAKLTEAAQHEGQPQGEKPQGEKAEGEKSQGEKPQGEKAQGEKPQGEKAQGEKPQGEKAQGEKPQGEKGESAKQLAQKQAELLAATQALLNSENANAQAEAATAQAQALAPQAVQPQLNQAQQHLGQAEKALEAGQPTPAGQQQAQALQNLNQALDKLNAQLAEMGLPQVHPGQPSEAQANGEPHQGQGQEPGQGQHPGQGQAQAQGQGQGQEPGQGQGQKGKSQEQNQQQGKGERQPDGTLKNTASSLADMKGGDSFLYLPQRQRDLIRQALSEGLPAEYAAQIQQYYVNLARGRAANTPAVTEKKK